MKQFFYIVVPTAIAWLPYYFFGVRYGNQFAEEKRFFLAGLVVSATCLLGFFALHYLQKQFSGEVSVVNYRMYLICGTQLMAVGLLAWDSNFNIYAIGAAFMVVLGGVLGVQSLR